MRGNVRLKGVPVGPTRRGQVLGPPVGDRVWVLWEDGMTSLCAARALEVDA